MFLLAKEWEDDLSERRKKGPLTAQEIEEEKNLLYIALTRSTNLLVVVGSTISSLLQLLQ